MGDKKEDEKKDKIGWEKQASSPKVLVALEAAVSILKQEPNQKMLVTIFCSRLKKTKSGLWKVVNGLGGIEHFCEITGGRLKFLPGEKAEVCLLDTGDPAPVVPASVVTA